MNDRPTPKRDRLLELHEQGLSRSQIAERLGITVSSVNNAIRLAKQRKSELQRKRQGS